MSRYLKLVNFELGRFMKIYLALIAITIVSQITGVIVMSNVYLNNAHEAIYGNSIPKAQFIEEYGQMSLLEVSYSLWFTGPIVLCIAALIFYMFLIWYRDWFGKNTFIYRLLMLPMARIKVFYAKATAIMLMTFGLVSIQLMLVPIEGTVLQWLVPRDFRIDMGISAVLQGMEELQVLFPYSFIEFITHYGIGFMILLIVFTCILFERSYRLKGIFMGIGFVLLVFLLFFAPIILNDFMKYFYPTEMFIIQFVLGIVIIGLSIAMNKFLLNKKINV